MDYVFRTLNQNFFVELCSLYGLTRYPHLRDKETEVGSKLILSILTTEKEGLGLKIWCLLPLQQVSNVDTKMCVSADSLEPSDRLEADPNHGDAIRPLLPSSAGSYSSCNKNSSLGGMERETSDYAPLGHLASTSI